MASKTTAERINPRNRRDQPMTDTPEPSEARIDPRADEFVAEYRRGWSDGYDAGRELAPPQEREAAGVDLAERLLREANCSTPPTRVWWNGQLEALFREAARALSTHSEEEGRVGLIPWAYEREAIRRAAELVSFDFAPEVVQALNGYLSRTEAVEPAPSEGEQG